VKFALPANSLSAGADGSGRQAATIRSAHKTLRPRARSALPSGLVTDSDGPISGRFSPTWGSVCLRPIRPSVGPTHCCGIC
jgi:hypothetical protein